MPKSPFMKSWYFDYDEQSMTTEERIEYQQIMTRRGWDVCLLLTLAAIIGLIILLMDTGRI
jgi:hypothetical protein